MFASAMILGLVMKMTFALPPVERSMIIFDSATNWHAFVGVMTPGS